MALKEEFEKQGNWLFRHRSIWDILKESKNSMIAIKIEL